MEGSWVSGMGFSDWDCGCGDVVGAVVERKMVLQYLCVLDLDSERLDMGMLTLLPLCSPSAGRRKSGALACAGPFC